MLLSLKSWCAQFVDYCTHGIKINNNLEQYLVNLLSTLQDCVTTHSKNNGLNVHTNLTISQHKNIRYSDNKTCRTRMSVKNQRSLVRIHLTLWPLLTAEPRRGYWGNRNHLELAYYVVVEHLLADFRCRHSDGHQGHECPGRNRPQVVRGL